LRPHLDDETVVVGRVERKSSVAMTTRGGFRPVDLMADESALSIVTLERLERRRIPLEKRAAVCRNRFCVSS
jgi:hypothetical protein